MPGPRILVFAGSIQADAPSARLAGAALKELVKMDVDATRISLADYPLPLFDTGLEQGVPATARKLHDMMLAHRGIYIATAESNASIPSLLKNAIDWVSRVRGSRSPFHACVFALGAIAEEHGGHGALLSLRQVLELGLGALVIPEQVAIADVERAFDDAGDLVDQTLAKQLRASICRLVALAGTEH
jgi:NAD(P)H-dependent FMN reductase